MALQEQAEGGWDYWGQMCGGRGTLYVRRAGNDAGRLV